MWWWTLGLESSTCGDTWLTSEGNLDGLLEHVCVVSPWERRRRRIAVHLSEEEHEKRMFRIWCGFLLVFSYVVNSGMLLTSEHVVTQLQQEVFTVNAQVADQSGLADAVRVTNNRIWQRKRIITSTRLLFQVW